MILFESKIAGHYRQPAFRHLLENSETLAEFVRTFFNAVAGKPAKYDEH